MGLGGRRRHRHVVDSPRGRDQDGIGSTDRMPPSGLGTVSLMLTPRGFSDVSLHARSWDARYGSGPIRFRISSGEAIRRDTFRESPDRRQARSNDFQYGSLEE